jgi:hypothetical protein
MKDINGVDLEKGQIIIAATKSTSYNIPILKKAEILEVSEEDKPYLVLKYMESGRIVKIDGYMYATAERFCVIGENKKESD